MIKNLKVDNFKSLRSIDLELRNLNLLTGLNGSGKSSLIQVLLLLRQSKEEVSGDYLDNLYLKGNLIFAGVVQDIIYSEYHKTPKNVRITIELLFSKEKDYLKIHSDFIMDLNKESLNISNAHEKSNLRIGWLSKHSLFNNNFQYLFTERKNHEDNYRVSVDEVTNKRSLGMYGEHTVFFLHTYGDTTEVKNPILRHPKAKSHNLIDQVDAWLSEISPNTSVRTFLIDRENVDLKYNQGDYAYKPKHMGFGLSYALSVIVSLLTAREDKLIIIENPESHIHPRGQAELGRLIAVAAQTGAQLIIETHSDHILNGVRVAVKEQMANPDSIITYYFKRNQENRSSEISSIIMDEKAKLYQKIQDGTNAELPEGFFDEWTNSMFKLI